MFRRGVTYISRPFILLLLGLIFLCWLPLRSFLCYFFLLQLRIFLHWQLQFADELGVGLLGESHAEHPTHCHSVASQYVSILVPTKHADGKAHCSCSDQMVERERRVGRGDRSSKVRSPPMQHQILHRWR